MLMVVVVYHTHKLSRSTKIASASEVSSFWTRVQLIVSAIQRSNHEILQADTKFRRS